MRNHILYRTIFKHGGSLVDWVQERSPEQLIIRVWKWCNFRCIFCNVAENESVLSLKSSVREILAITLYKIKFSKILSNHINITISGWEPSIFQKETLFILKYFTSYFWKRNIHVAFDLQSNASNIDSIFAKKLMELWVVQALISSHAHDPIIFDQIIGVKYALMWPKFDQWVQNLLDVGIPVTFNIVLNKINKDHFHEHIQYLVEKYPSVVLYNIGFVQPHGMAQENFDKLIVQYSDISNIYNTVIAYLKSCGKRVHSHLVWLPLCYMDDWGSSMEFIHNKNLWLKSNDDQTLIQSINDNNKIHPKACESCRAKRVCSGVWKEYESIQKLKPYAYNITNIWATYTGDIGTMRKEYTGWKRQFFLDASFLSEEEIHMKLTNMKKWWYIWISIVYHEDSLLKNITQFAWTNIQFFLTSKTSKILIHQIYEYNKSVPFQFCIQLDILIPTLDGWKISDIFSIQTTEDIFVHIPRKMYKIKEFRKDRIYFSL